MEKALSILLLLIFINLFSQQKISGKVVTEENNLAAVLVMNMNSHKTTYTDISGNFSIDAHENDEVRFIKEGYYRADKIIKHQNLNSQMFVTLLRMETLIPEVNIKYKPTGNLKKDSEHFDDSKKVAALKSSMRVYMKSELNEPLPKNEIPKMFQGYDFQAGQVDVISVLGAAIGLITKSTQPKITTPNFYETQDFLNRIKKEVDLSFLKKYGMDEERIDHFLQYAEKVNQLSKKNRKVFESSAIEYQLKIAFVEYSKLNKLSK